jgi:hypothetical protein
MPTTVLSQMAVHCESIVEVTPAIVFDCVVEGRKLKAKITHREDNGVQYIYHISFGDGYAATFVSSLEAGSWHSDHLSSPYAKAIHDDLNAFCGFVLHKPAFCIRLKDEKDAFNVWVVPSAFKASHYSVYYKGDYRFSLRKRKEWEVNTVRESGIIDHQIASIVCKNIEQRTTLLLFEEA